MLVETDRISRITVSVHQMPFVGIAHVVEDDFLHVDGLLRPIRGGIGSAGDTQEQQQCNCYMSEYTHFRIYFLDENVLLRAQKYGKNSYPQTLSAFIIIMSRTATAKASHSRPYLLAREAASTLMLSLKVMDIRNGRVIRLTTGGRAKSVNAWFTEKCVFQKNSTS